MTVLARQNGAVKLRCKPREQEEEDALLREWRQWHREQWDAALAGPYGAILQGLGALLKVPANPSALLAYIQSKDWSQASWDARLEALHQINQCVIRTRRARGLPPFDDPIDPDDPENVFMRCRAILVPPDACYEPDDRED